MLLIDRYSSGLSDIILQYAGPTKLWVSWELMPLALAQIAINWLVQRPTIATVIIGARKADQLRQNLGAVDWNLSRTHLAKLDASSATTPIYPYWHQRGFAERNPSPV